MHDLKYGLRTLLRQPAFTAVAVLSLALGIGLNTTIFSIVNAVLLKKLPVEDPGSLVEIYTSPSEEFPYLTTSYLDFLSIKAEVDALQDVMAHAMVRGIMTTDGRPELVSGEVVTANYFDLLGVPMAHGRAFRPEEDVAEGAQPVIVLSHGLWQRRFGGAPSVIGESIRLSGIAYTVIGVATERYTGSIPGLRPEFWVPTAMVERLSFSGIQATAGSTTEGTRRERRGTRWLFVKGRLAPGATVEMANTQLSTVFARLAQEYADTNEDIGGVVLPAASVRFHPMVDGILAQAGGVLLVAVGLVLMIACANVANMLLSRAANRSREISVRLSVGASRGRLVRQLMTESALLATLGGVVGVGLAYWAAKLLSAFQPPLPVPIEFAYEVDTSVMVFAFGACLFTAVLFGLVPALRASRPNLIPALKGESGAFSAGDTSSVRKRFTLSKALVVGQLAVSLVLIVAGALLTRGLIEAQRMEIGYEPERIASLGFNLQMNNYTLERAQALQRTLLEKLPSIPGVESVSLASRLPMAPDINMEGIFVPGLHETEKDAVPVDAVYVGSDYFEVTDIAIVHGRAFEDSDREGSPRVAVVNEAMAERYWPGQNPVGRRITLDGPDGEPVEVIGVSRNHKVRSLAEDPRPYVHFARAQVPTRQTLVIARTSGPAEPLVPSLRAAILEVEPEIVFTEEGTGADVVEVTLLPARVGARLLGAFGGLALLLAAIGLYGVIAYSVSRRRREVGLRMAMGANGADVLRMMLWQGMSLASVGVALGVVVAALLAEVLQGLLYGVSPVDPVAYGTAALLLLAVAASANLIPAWRAASVSPMTALRYE